MPPKSRRITGYDGNAFRRASLGNRRGGVPLPRDRLEMPHVGAGLSRESGRAHFLELTPVAVIVSRGTRITSRSPLLRFPAGVLCCLPCHGFLPSLSRRSSFGGCRAPERRVARPTRTRQGAAPVQHPRRRRRGAPSPGTSGPVAPLPRRAGCRSREGSLNRERAALPRACPVERRRAFRAGASPWRGVGP